MPQTIPLMLPVPRVVTGVKRRVRSGEAERLCVLDDVPVLVPSATEAEAPLALTVQTNHYRAFGGALYRPLFATWMSGASPEDVADAIRARADQSAGTEHRNHGWRDKGERVVDVKGTFQDAKRDRGLRSVEGHQLREIHDDGLAAQRALADGMAGNLLLVDGGLWHRAPCPMYVLQAKGRLCDPVVSTCSIDSYASQAYHEDVRGDGRVSTRMEMIWGAPWMTFMPHEADKAEAFGEALGSAPWHGRGRILPDGVKGMKVVDGAAYATSVPGRDAAAVLSGMISFHLTLTGSDLSGMADEGIQAFVEARRAVADLAAGGDPDAAYERFRPYADAIEAGLEPVVDGRGMAGGEDAYLRYGDAAELLHATRAMRIRYERFESPRPELYDVDSPEVAALAGLAR